MEAEQDVGCDKARASAAVMAWRRLYDRGRDNNYNRNDNDKSTIRSTHVTDVEHCMSGMASNNNKIEMKINVVTSGGSMVNTDDNNNDYGIAIAATALQSRGRAVHNDDAEVVDFTAAVDQGTNGYSGGTTVLEDVALIKNSSILCRGGSVDVAGGEQQQLANTYVVLSNGEANQLQHQQVKPSSLNNGEDYDHDNSNQGVNNDSNGYEGSTDFVVAEVAELEINDSKRLVGNSVLDWLIGTGVLILQEYTLRSTSHDGILSCPRNNTSLNHRSAMGSDYPVGTKDLYLCLDRRSVVLDPTLLIHRSVIAEEQDSNKTERIKTSLKNLDHRSVIVEGQDSSRTERIKTSLKNLVEHRSVIVEGRDSSRTERIKTSLKNLEKMIDCTDDTQRVGVVATYVVTTMNAGCSKTTPKSQEKMMGSVDNALSVGATYIVTATMGVGYDEYEDTKIEEQEEEAPAAAEEVAMYIVTTDADATGSNDQQDTNKQRREAPVDVEVATCIVTNNTDAGCTRNKIDNQQETREEIEEEIDVEGATYIVTTDTESEEDSEEDTKETVDVDEATYIVTSGSDIECSEKEIEEYKEDASTGVGDTYIVTADTDVKHVESRQEEIELEDDLPGNEGAAYIVTAGSVWNVNKNNSRYGSGSKFSLRILQSRANFVNMGWTFMLELVLKIALEFGLTLGVLWQMAGVWFDWTWIYVSSRSRFSIDATDYPVGSKDLHLWIDRRSVLGKVRYGDINGNDRLSNRNDEVAAKNNGWLGCTNYGLIITI